MSNSDMYRRRAQRHNKSAIKNEKKLAGIADKIGKKQGDLAKAKSPAAQKRIQRQLISLFGDQADAQQDSARHRKQAGTAQERLVSSEASEQKNLDRQRKRDERALQRSLAATTNSVVALDQRLSSVELSLIERVREEIAAEPGERDHDVFLSYAGPDEDVARDLYVRLAERGLRVWFAPFSRRLGESLTRQLDKGIASSTVGVPLITKDYLSGRYWTEQEYGAFFSTRKRIIPVLHGVGRRELGAYSPMLSDKLGLDTKELDLDEIADDITEALAEKPDEC